MSASLPHEEQPHPAADLATMVRARLRRPAPALPRADLALAKAAIAIILLGLAATAAILALPRLKEPPAGTLQPARVGGVALLIPRELTGVDPEEEVQVVGLARLRLSWPALGPVTEATGRRLLVTLSPQDKVNEPATQLSVYARFLTPTVWSNPGGLVVRGFRSGSPYAGDELYVSAPDGRGFAARCPLDAGAASLEEPCRVTFRHRGLDVNIRFPRAIVAEWALMLGGVRRVIDGLIR